MCGGEHKYTACSFLFFLGKKYLESKKKNQNINISYFVMVLIKMRLIIFLVSIRYRLAQHMAGCKIVFSNNWINVCQSGKVRTYLLLLIKCVRKNWLKQWISRCEKRDRQNEKY